MTNTNSTTISNELGVSILMRIQLLADEIAKETGHSERGLMMTFTRLLTGYMAACVGEQIARTATNQAINDGIKLRRELLK